MLWKSKYFTNSFISNIFLIHKIFTINSYQIGYQILFENANSWKCVPRLYRMTTLFSLFLLKTQNFQRSIFFFLVPTTTGNKKQNRNQFFKNTSFLFPIFRICLNSDRLCQLSFLEDLWIIYRSVVEPFLFPPPFKGKGLSVSQRGHFICLFWCLELSILRSSVGMNLVPVQVFTKQNSPFTISIKAATYLLYQVSLLFLQSAVLQH